MKGHGHEEKLSMADKSAPLYIWSVFLNLIEPEYILIV